MGSSVDVTTKLATAKSKATSVPSLPHPPFPSSAALLPTLIFSSVIPDDLGVVRPKEVLVDSFPGRLCSGREHTFQCSVKGDAACCPCRQFRAYASLDLTFTVKGCENSFPTLTLCSLSIKEACHTSESSPANTSSTRGSTAGLRGNSSGETG